MKILENTSLKAYNTFGIDVKARFFTEISSLKQLREALAAKEYGKKFVLSGGSNLLLTKDLNKMVLYINIRGKSVISETKERVSVKVMAGEDWHELVLWTLDQDYGGLENLSLIPGKTGTAPIQNIGAYGVELKDVFESCEAMDVSSLEIQKFSKEDCNFGYRDSFFKREGKGKFIITSVTFNLTKRNHRLNTSYAPLKAALEEINISSPSIQDVSRAVIQIRSSKLPDPKEIGNSGSFFKNPVVSENEWQILIKNFPEMPYYPQNNGGYKIPAAWLIDSCGFKGKRIGDAGVHKKQALVLVNYGNANGNEILALARNIQEAVEMRFGISLRPEVNILD